MSQNKVDGKKNERQNRKAAVKKRKVIKAVQTVVVSLVAFVLLAWVGISLYKKVDAVLEANNANGPAQYEEIDISAVTDYLSGLE